MMSERLSERLILPPAYVPINAPLIFLAGPIQGAYDWQDEAAEKILAIAPKVYIASPRRNTAYKGEFTPQMFYEQVDWETYHLRKAGEDGVIMFWLAKEFEHFCSRAYAQTTRFELGEWKVRHERDGVKLVVGMEQGFTNYGYIARRLSKDCPGIHICSSLEGTCEEAVRQVDNIL